MSGILPTEKVKATRINPKIIVVYSMPKVGKTTSLRDLDDCLTFDIERGGEMYDMLRISIDNIPQFDAAIAELRFKLNERLVANTEAGMSPQEAYRKAIIYRRLAIDTLDKLEEYCEASATEKYKASTLGEKFKGESVLLLPNGAGYYHLRNELLDKVDTAARLCETLILSCHVKDKITEKGGIEVKSQDLSLAGKLGAMICAKADLIIYLYRERGKPLMASLETNSTTVMGGRDFPHINPLIGKQFEFSWDKILVDAPVIA